MKHSAEPGAGRRPRPEDLRRAGSVNRARLGRPVSGSCRAAYRNRASLSRSARSACSRATSAARRMRLLLVERAVAQGPRVPGRQRAEQPREPVPPPRVDRRRPGRRAARRLDEPDGGPRASGAAKSPRPARRPRRRPARRVERLGRQRRDEPLGRSRSAPRAARPGSAARSWSRRARWPSARANRPSRRGHGACAPPRHRRPSARGILADLVGLLGPPLGRPDEAGLDEVEAVEERGRSRPRCG